MPKTAAPQKASEPAKKEEGKPEEELAQAKASEDAAETERAGVLLSPEGVMMLFLAGIIDLIDFLIGSFWVMDIVAILTIGIWLYLHSQRMSVTRGAATRLGKVSKWAKRAKWLRPLAIVTEFIPIVGMLPCWLLLVYAELKS